MIKDFLLLMYFQEIKKTFLKICSKYGTEPGIKVFMDKTDKNIEMLKVNEKSINLLKRIYKIINSSYANIDEKTKEKLKELDKEYHSLTKKHGAAITDVIRIGRKEEDLHYILEDADFSKYRIKKLIHDGERDAENAIKEKEFKDNDSLVNV